MQAEKVAYDEALKDAGAQALQIFARASRMEEGELKKAVREAEEAMDEKTLEEKLYEKLDKGALDDANRLVDAALESVPDNPMALINKGRILKRMAMVESDEKKRESLLKQAIKYVSRASELYPNQGAPFYNIACYQALLNVDRSEVFKNLKRACELNPQLKTIALADSDFDNVKQDPEFKELTGIGNG